MLKNVILIMLSFCLSSCAAGRWYKAGASQEEFGEVKYRCLQEAQQPQASAYSSYANGYKNSNNQFSGAYSSGMVTNEELFNACMNAYGFYWVTTDGL